MYKRILLILIFILSVIILSISIKTYRITKKISHNPNFVTKLILPNNDNPIELVYTDYGFGLFVASKDGSVSQTIKDKGSWEPEMVDALNHLVKPGNIVVHLGTHIGFHDVVLGKIVGPTGHVYAFEPNPESYDIVKKNLVINNLDNIFTLYPLGVTDKLDDGQKSHICFDYAHTGGGFVSKNTIDEKSKCTDITLTSLDNTLSDLPKIDVLFMDIEGFELKAINGASALLKRSPEAIIILEWTPDFFERAGSSNAKEFIQSYMKDGYKFFQITETIPAKYIELSSEELFSDKPFYQINVLIVPKTFIIENALLEHFTLKQLQG